MNIPEVEHRELLLLVRSRLSSRLWEILKARAEGIPLRVLALQYKVPIQRVRTLHKKALHRANQVAMYYMHGDPV